MSKTWFITGISSGIGYHMTEQLLRRGDRVIGTARRVGLLDALGTQFGRALQVVRLDLTNSTAMRAVVNHAFADAGRIDVVVSNAGYGLFGAAEELSDAQIDDQIATNLVASIQLIRATLPRLRQQGGGRIVQVSSEGGQIAYPNFSLYHATKWGIEGFIEAVAQEVAPFGIEFLIAEPGPTSTGFSAALVRADAMPEYQDTPSGELRRRFATTAFSVRADASRTAAAIIAGADLPTAPLRLTLGSSAFKSVSRALEHRLRLVQSQEALAASADAAL